MIFEILGPLNKEGLIPNWARLGPHTVMAMTLFEQFRKLAGVVPL